MVQLFSSAYALGKCFKVTEYIQIPSNLGRWDEFISGYSNELYSYLFHMYLKYIKVNKFVG